MSDIPLHALCQITISLYINICLAEKIAHGIFDIYTLHHLSCTFSYQNTRTWRGDYAFLLFLCKINIDALHVLRLEESVFKANIIEERLTKLKEPKETVFSYCGIHVR